MTDALRDAIKDAAKTIGVILSSGGPIWSEDVEKIVAAAIEPVIQREVEKAEDALYLELESAIRNHLKKNPGLSGDPFFALQSAFTLCRRKPAIRQLGDSL